MWIMFIVSLFRTCEVEVKELNLFPIREENYVLPVRELFKGNNLSYTCTNCPKGINMMNAMFTLTEKENYGFTSLSISSNQTHFASLTLQNTLNMYNKELDLILSTKIPEQLQCFNAIFLITNEILLDCYKENQLQFLILNQSELLIYQNFSTYFPLSTQLVSFLTNDKQTVLYAQYYKQNSFLTLLVKNETNLYNASVFNHEVIDFSVSTKGFIYVLTPHLGMFQVIVNSSFVFSILTNFHNSVDTQIKIFTYSSFQLSSQFDQIFIANTNYEVSLQYYTGQYGSISFIGDFDQVQFNFSDCSVIYIGISDYYLLIQQDNVFTIFFEDLVNLQSQRNFSIYHLNKSQNDYIYAYFDPYNNVLYEFSNKIQQSSIQNPQLNGKFQEQESQKFIVSASETQAPFIPQFCQIQFNYNIVEKNDTSIYLAYNKKFPLLLMEDSSMEYILDNFSGSLQQIDVKLEDFNLAEFIDLTFQQVNFTFNKQFEMSKMYYYVQFFDAGYIFLGVVKNNVYLYFCNETYCNEFFQTQFEQKITQIEFSFFQMSTILVAINQGHSTIFVLEIDYNLNLQFTDYSIYLVELFTYPFKCFILMYQQLIILTQTNKLNIVLNDGYVVYQIDEKDIIRFFHLDKEEQFKFNPKSMISNQQNQATFLVLNNIDSFIILGVQFFNKFIPINLTKVNIKIQELSLVNNQLILTYINKNLLCFQVYQISNLFQPIYQKELPCTVFKKGWSVQSDNINFYVDTNYNNQVLVYNPALPYHSSLYYSINGTLQSCTNVQSKSFIYLAFNLYQLQPYFLFKFQSNNIFLPQYIQNTKQIINVTSKLNQTSFVQVNSSVSIINTFTQIEKYLQIKTNISKFQNFSFNLNELVKYQIISYKPYQKQNSTDFTCSFQSFFRFNESKSCQNYSIVTTYKDQLILQNQFQLFLPLSIEQNYRHINYKQNFTKCLISTIYQNQLYSICQQLKNVYLIIFNISTSYNFTQTQQILLPVPCQNIMRFIQFNNLTMLLGQDVVQIEYHYIYIFDIYNTSKITVQNISCYKGIQDFAFEYLYSDNKQGQVLAFFYICKGYLQYRLGYFNPLTNILILDYNAGFILKRSKQIQKFKYTELLQIVSLGVKLNQILLLLTTTNVTNIFFTMTFSKQIYVKDKLHLSGLIQSIPPYGNYTLTYSAIAMNGMLLFIFHNSLERIYAIYNYTNLHQSLETPLIFIGGISKQLPLPQSITLNYDSNKQVGWIFDITNETLYSYQFEKQNILNCQANGAIKQNQQFFIDISNSFSTGTIEFIFEYQKEHSTFWIILLVIIILTSIFAMIHIFSKKQPAIEDYNLDEGFEL